MTKLFKTYFAEIKGIDDKNMTVDVVVSTKTKDRDGDIIEPEAFKKSLKIYKTNPVLLSSHSHHDLTKVIGKAESIKVTDKGLEAKFKYFADQGNAEADWAFKLAQNGIAAFSVGFIGKQWDDLENKDKEGRLVYGGRRFTEVELLEVSQVTIPSNPDATIRNSFDEVESEVYELACKAFDWQEKENKQDDNDMELKKIVDDLIDKIVDLERQVQELKESKEESIFDVLFDSKQENHDDDSNLDFTEEELKNVLK